MAASHPTQEPLLLPLASDRATLPLAGGKGANLARLVRAGFPVPHGFVISTEAYASFVAANDLARHILSELEAEGRAADLSGGEAHEATSSRIRARFSEATMPASFWDQILAAYAGLGRPPVAVRSSATAEDLPDMSFAGQQDTFLNVIGDEALLAAVTACWSSLWTARAISYREHNRVSHGDVSIAVVVQKMVQSEAAGVLFTANPLTGLRTETVIDATLGLGEALVGGRVQPDHYVVDRCTGQITSRALGAKALSIRGKDGGGTETVAESAAATQALPDAQILELAALGDRVAGMFDMPQDIEWAWADSSLSLLQTRPITSLFPTPDGMAAEPLRVMLSFGGMQGMLDPVTALGRDLLFRIAAAIGRLFGMHLTPESQNVFYAAGERPWINLTPLLRNTVGRKLLPVITRFIDPAAEESLNAIWDDPRLQPTRRGVSPRAVSEILRFLVPTAGHVLLNVAAPRTRRRFIVERGERVLRTAAGNISGIAGDPQERLGQLARISAAFVAERVPRTFRLFVSGVAAAMASYNVLRILTKDLPGVTRDHVLEVTRGVENNPTTEMDLSLWQASLAIRHDPASLAAFETEAPSLLAVAYGNASLPTVAQQVLDAFLARYGARGLAEIDLGRPRWAEEPTHVLEVIRGYLQISDPSRSPDAVFSRSMGGAEAAVAALVSAARRGPHGWLRARQVRFAAGRTRSLMGVRESPKFFVVRLLGVLRGELLSVGAQLAARGDLSRPDDLFHLSFAELVALADGAGRDWQGLVAQRRQAYDREFTRRQLPRLLLSDGRAFYQGLTAAGGAAGDLAGSPVSPGSVTGPVRVVSDPRRAGLLPGEILVCRGTDPSWTPLFLTAGGLVMEVGGLMTHGAVVAREYGIPAVVGVDRATERLQTGQRISLDGSTGRITIVDAADAATEDETRSP
jgi:pyruvate,water dikinase